MNLINIIIVFFSAGLGGAPTGFIILAISSLLRKRAFQQFHRLLAIWKSGKIYYMVAYPLFTQLFKLISHQGLISVVRFIDGTINSKVFSLSERFDTVNPFIHVNRRIAIIVLKNRVANHTQNEALGVQ